MLITKSRCTPAHCSLQCCCNTTYKLCLTILSLLRFPVALPLFHSLNPPWALFSALSAFSHWVPGASQQEATHTGSASGETPALNHFSQLCMGSVYICGEGRCVKQPVADQGSLGHPGTSRNRVVSAPAAEAACREGGKESCKVVAVTQNGYQNPSVHFIWE